LARDYFNVIDNPWTKLKLDKFGLKGKPLHASGKCFTYEQRTALNNFFHSNTFGRFTTILSVDTQNDTLLELDEIVYRNFYNRILDIIRWYEFEDIIIIYDDSTRLKPKLQKYSAGIEITEKANGVETNFDTHYCVINKKYAFPGIEVADFIIHSAGTTLRDLLNGKIRKLTDREDFSYIFEKIDGKYSSFLHLNSVSFTSKE